MLISRFDPKDPREQLVLTLDATDELEAGETLAGISAVELTPIKGQDADVSDMVVYSTVNSTVLSVQGNSVAIGKAVQLVIKSGSDKVTYLINVTCPTSNSQKILVLKGILPVEILY